MGDIISGIGSIIGSGKTAAAAEDAARTQQIMYMQTRADLSPFIQAGAGVLPSLSALATSGLTGGGPDYVTMAQQNMPLQMTQNALEQTPGYQWNLAQGLKATQSAAAARGLGVSGASLKGAATYATGLADSTYKNQFDMAQSRFSDFLNMNTGQQNQLTGQYARLHDTAALGATAAAGLGTQGTQLAQNYGQAQMNQGAAESAGIQGLTKGIGSALNFGTGQALLPTAGGPTKGY